MVNDKINVVGTNIAEKAIMIWNVADMLRDPFKPHEYGLVILPMIHFNPRSPCGERRILRRRSLQPCIISIHAPRVGSDEMDTRIILVPKISIHAPRVGSDGY